MEIVTTGDENAVQCAKCGGNQCNLSDGEPQCRGMLFVFGEAGDYPEIFDALTGETAGKRLPVRKIGDLIVCCLSMDSYCGLKHFDTL